MYKEQDSADLEAPGTNDGADARRVVDRLPDRLEELD